MTGSEVQSSTLDVGRSTFSPPWRWQIFPALARLAFAVKPDIPLPIWASKHVFLDRRMTTRPGYPDPDEYPWTWEYQEIIRTRHVWEKEIEPGVTVIVDPGTEGATCERVHQMDVMKATQTAITEGALNGIRYCAKHDPQNIIFAIDNVKQAGEVNEIRLQPTLRKLGEEIFTDDKDDAGKFLIKLRRMLIYFLGSYSSGAFSQKMCELGFNDELEEHGTSDSVDDLESRMKSSRRRLLVNMSKPKDLVRDEEGRIIGGPIALEHSQGSCHVAEVPCPHCSADLGLKNDELRKQQTAGLLPSSFIIPTSDLTGFQQLEQDNMKFGHCKTLLEEWDFKRVLKETFFECIHCHRPIEETWKRWMSDRKRRRWRRTNFIEAEPNHISFHISDFLSFDESVTWGRLAIKYIKSRGDPVKRRTYRNHHEGLPWEIKTVRTELSDLLLLRGSYKRGMIPWFPRAIILTADVGQLYVKWGVYAFRNSIEGGEGECALIDWGKDLHPDDIAVRVKTLQYPCLETGKTYPISLGVCDAKFRRIEVHKACLRVPRRLYPSAGLRAGMMIRSISFNRVPQRPAWFGIIVYNDDDAKGEIYTDRIGAWAAWLKQQNRPASAGDENLLDEKPLTGRLWLPEDIQRNALYGGKHGGDPKDNILDEHMREHFIVKRPGLPPVWDRKGANEGGDLSKVACCTWRFFTLLETGEIGEATEATTPEVKAAIGVGNE